MVLNILIFCCFCIQSTGAGQLDIKPETWSHLVQAVIEHLDMRDPVFLIRGEDSIHLHVKLFKQCSSASSKIKLTTKITDIDRSENVVVLSKEV